MNFPAAKNLRQFLMAALVFISALGALEVLIRYRETQIERTLRAQATQYLSAVRARIEGTFNSSIYLTNALNALVASQGHLDWADFDSVALALTLNSHHIRNVALAEGYVITRVYPRDGNEHALGFDFRTNATQWPAVREAIEKEQTQVAGPLDLIQGGVGVITRTPIYVPDPKQPGERVYWGLSSVVIDFNTILEEAGLPDPESNYRIAIRGRDGLGAEGRVFWGEPELFQAKPVTMSVSFPNGSWQLAAAPKGKLYQHNDAIVIRTGATLIALLLGALTLVMIRDSRRLRHMALHDPLTGLPNRLLLERQLTQTIAHARRHQRLFALAVLDLNGFKPVNDTYGHLAGDFVLTETARRIQKRIRQEDTLARTGGDEFTLLLTEINEPTDAVSVAKTLASAIRQPFNWEGAQITLAVSVGIAIYPDHGDDLNGLFQHADLAMYQAKDAANSDWAIAEPDPGRIDS